jgi:hypothetical protein
VRSGRVQPGDGVRQVGRHLVGPDHDQVEVRYQGECPAALAAAVVENDRPGLGDGGRAAGDHAGHRVELAGGQRRVVEHHPVRGRPAGLVAGAGFDRAVGRQARQPLRRQSVRDQKPGDVGQHAGDGRGQVRLGDALDDGAVVGRALGEQRDDVAAGGVVVGAPIVARERGVGGVDLGRGPRAARGVRADRGADAVEDHLAGGAHAEPPRVRDHQARKDSGGGAGASRVSVQADRGGGRRRMRPDRPTKWRLADAARWAAARRRGELST